MEKFHRYLTFFHSRIFPEWKNFKDIWIFPIPVSSNHNLVKCLEIFFFATNQTFIKSCYLLVTNFNSVLTYFKIPLPRWVIIYLSISWRRITGGVGWEDRVPHIIIVFLITTAKSSRLYSKRRINRRKEGWRISISSKGSLTIRIASYVGSR